MLDNMAITQKDSTCQKIDINSNGSSNADNVNTKETRNITKNILSAKLVVRNRENA